MALAALNPVARRFSEEEEERQYHGILFTRFKKHRTNPWRVVAGGVFR